MKKYCATLLALLLISALLLTGCNFNINNNQVEPSTEDNSSAPTVDAAGADDDFTTDMDILVDLIPTENTDSTEDTESTEATETEPDDTNKPPEPVPPSPTNSSGEIELPIIPG